MAAPPPPPPPVTRGRRAPPESATPRVAARAPPAGLSLPAHPPPLQWPRSRASLANLSRWRSTSLIPCLRSHSGLTTGPNLPRHRSQTPTTGRRPIPSSHPTPCIPTRTRLPLLSPCLLHLSPLSTQPTPLPYLLIHPSPLLSTSPTPHPSPCLRRCLLLSRHPLTPSSPRPPSRRLDRCTRNPQPPLPLANNTDGTPADGPGTGIFLC